MKRREKIGTHPEIPPAKWRDAEYARKWSAAVVWLLMWGMIFLQPQAAWSACNTDTSSVFAVDLRGKLVNTPPTLDSIANLAFQANAPSQVVNLTGISAGSPNEAQKITLTATSDRPGLISNPTVNYTSPNTSGTLTFVLVANASGTATIIVTVKDDGGTANGGQDTITRSFQVTVAKPPELYVNSITLKEGNSGTTQAVFDVELRGANSLPVTVHFATVNGSATAGSDYQSLSGQLEFPASGSAGAPRLDISQSGNNLELRWSGAANAFELFETDSFGLTAWSKSALAVHSQGNEQSVVLPVPSGVRFFRLAPAAARPATMVQQVRVLVQGDEFVEPDENFFLRLSAPVNAVIGQGSGECIILNDDTELPPPPPIARIVTPETDDVFPTGTSIIVTAEATANDSTVTNVEFFANGQSIGSTTTPPFIITWPNVAPGAYNLTARATNAKSATGDSPSVSITVEDECAGCKRVAVVQNFSAPEISKLQAWLSDLNLNSHVFDQKGLSIEALQGYDLVIWDDLGTLTDGLSANDVAIFAQLHSAGVPLYLIGEVLARATGGLPANLQSVWTGLLHLKPASSSLEGKLVSVGEERHAVTNGPFGLISGFDLESEYDLSVATGNGETVLARVGNADVVLAHEEAATSVRTVTQDVLAFEGAGLTAGMQREKLFKNAVWWLLNRLPPPPFMNLAVTLTAPAEPLAVGQSATFTAEVRHGGELEATGITLTVTLPDGFEFASAQSDAGSCTLEDGVVVCLLGRLSHAEIASAAITISPTISGTATLGSSVSANQAEAQRQDNYTELTVKVSP